MLQSKLLDFEYYRKKLPLYLQNSVGMSDQFRVIYDLLLSMDNSEDAVMDALCIYDSKYLDYINSLEGANVGTVSDILDKIGEIYGVERKFDVDYIDTYDVSHHVALNLNNELMLLLIKGRIIQNCYDGSAEMAQAFYDSTGLPILFYTDPSVSGTCHIILAMSQSEVSTQLEALFMSGLLTIMSMGIVYSHSIYSMTNAMTWDSLVNTWDVGGWQ